MKMSGDSSPSCLTSLFLLNAKSFLESGFGLGFPSCVDLKGLGT